MNVEAVVSNVIDEKFPIYLDVIDEYVFVSKSWFQLCMTVWVGVFVSKGWFQLCMRVGVLRLNEIDKKKCSIDHTYMQPVVDVITNVLWIQC